MHFVGIAIRPILRQLLQFQALNLLDSSKVRGCFGQVFRFSSLEADFPKIRLNEDEVELQGQIYAVHSTNLVSFGD